MFKTRKTKIVSAPAEEILEVEAPQPVVNEPQIVYNIERLTIISQDEEAAVGTLIDSNDNQYKYVWDKKLKRISELSGDSIDALIWNLCDSVLNKYFIRPEAKQPEVPVELKIAEALKVALAPILSSITSLEKKINTKQVASAPAPVYQPAPRPQIVQSAPMDDTPAISVADSDISMNAMRFLQQAGSDDPSIDFMSL